MSKYIFITGGVVSNLGKGITGVALGRLLIERGLKVNFQRYDPRLNFDLGLINPIKYGEVFVTHDGVESALALGYVERFLDNECDKYNYLTTGKILADMLINNNNNADENTGMAIQQIPHMTSEIKKLMKKYDSNYDVVIIEIGGTVGDIDNAIYLEAVRQMQYELGEDNYIHIHCTLVPYMESTEELKTKPTQYSVKSLNTYGLRPDIIVCRTTKDKDIDDRLKKKLAMYCNLKSADYVIQNKDAENIYEVPLNLANEGIDRIVIGRLNLPCTTLNLSDWQKMINIMNDESLPSVNIALVGKYTENQYSYLSVTDAIRHACFQNKYRAKITLISSEDIEMYGEKEILRDYDGIVVPGGFGSNGIEGKILTAKYARENKVPFLGLCLGMQISVIDFARNVAGLAGATSTEFDPNTTCPVIHKMEESKVNNYEKSMRLGDYKCKLKEGSLARRMYGKPTVTERHRHRYEFNNEYRELFESLGLVVSGVNEDRNLVEIIEYNDHPFYIASQFHPEFKSRPYKPHPLFVGFVNSAISNIKKPKISK